MPGGDFDVCGDAGDLVAMKISLLYYCVREVLLIAVLIGSLLAFGIGTYHTFYYKKERLRIIQSLKYSLHEQSELHREHEDQSVRIYNLEQQVDTLRKRLIDR